MNSASSLWTLLEIDWPIVQAPMVGTSTPALAAAVSNAGVLGSIGLGAMDAKDAGTAISVMRERTERPFNVNLFCHVPAPKDEARETAWLAPTPQIRARGRLLCHPVLAG